MTYLFMLWIFFATFLSGFVFLDWALPRAWEDR